MSLLRELEANHNCNRNIYLATTRNALASLYQDNAELANRLEEEIQNDVENRVNSAVLWWCDNKITEETEQRSCICCSEIIPVRRSSQLMSGQHIKFLETAEHFILINVDCQDEHNVNLLMISMKNDKPITKSEMIDISQQQCVIVDYKKKQFVRNKVVVNAENLQCLADNSTTENKFNIFELKTGELFCLYSCTGIRCGSKINLFIQKIKNNDFLFRFFLKINENIENLDFKNMGSFTLLEFAMMNIIDINFMMLNICSSCRLQITNMLLKVIKNYKNNWNWLKKKGAAISSLIIGSNIMVIASVLCISHSSWLKKMLIDCGYTMHDVFVCDLKAGDVIAFKYYGLWHTAILIKNRKRRKGINILHFIHYANRGSNKKAIIAGKKTLKRFTTMYMVEFHDAGGFSPTEVVRRATSRLGEEKWSIVRNRSVHFCHWAKVMNTFTLFVPHAGVD